MNLKKIIINALGISLIYGCYGCFATDAWSLTFKIPRQGNVIGEYQKIKAKQGDSLPAIAQYYDIGMYEIYVANPHLPHRGLKAGTTVIIPSQFILPNAPRTGIVLNLADMRIFYYHPDGVTVSTYPVGIGRGGWSTPLGTTQIVAKKANPTWTPPPSIIREAARKGRRLPAVYPPGPKNPLGAYAMNLGFPRILMHGTNAPRSVGLRSSHGCIRLFPADIEELFHNVSVGTPVRIVYDPHGRKK
jgi:L,D-transpeptidase ErfK/SrfK